MKQILSFFLFMYLSFQIQGQDANDNWIFHHQTDDGWFGSIVKDNFGNIIVGGGGSNSHFRVYDGNSWTLYKPEDFNVTYGFYGRHMAIGPDNVLWIAQGNSDGLTSWDGTNIQNYNTANSDIISNSIFGVGVSSDNTIWHTALQSYDGNDWNEYPMSCTTGLTGSKRDVFFTASSDTWITGGISKNIDLGTIYQPCVYQIKEDSLSTFHVNEGDNLPVLSASGGNHLMSQLSDESLLMFGKTDNGIEVKKFNGSSWEDFDNYLSSEIDSSAYWGIYTEENNSIWLCGSKHLTNAISQIVNYCNGQWTVYNLPESDGFPSALHDVLIDDDELWVVGNTGIMMVELLEESCTSTSIKEFQDSKSHCESITYNNQYISINGCTNIEYPLKYNLVNNLGQNITTGIMTYEKVMIKSLATGIYFFQIKDEKNNFKTFKFLVK